LKKPKSTSFGFFAFIAGIDLRIQNLIYMTKDYLNIKEASAFTGISVSTLYKAVSNRKIPVFRPTGKLLFSKEELIRWIENSKQETLHRQ
jgi:excisionase family DNA binding protein